MRYYKVPGEAIRRLPTYLRALWLLSEKGDMTVSSTGLAEFLGIKAWQIRKDFSYFGGFGKRGVGYDIETLTEEIKKILKLDVIHKAALVGVGNLGLVVLAYPGFKKYGFEIVACFDNDPKKVGTRIHGMVVEDMSKICTLRKRDVDIAVLAVPRSAAQQTEDDLIDVGVNGILKFSPGFITVPKKVKVITVDIAIDFARLPYYMPSNRPSA